MPRRTPRLGAHVALDRAALGVMTALGRAPEGDELSELTERAEQFEAHLDARGHLQRPLGYHADPKAPTDVGARAAKAGGVDVEFVSFASEFPLDPEEPGGAAWAGQGGNDTVRAVVLRHRGDPRPWVVCVHGFGMGRANMDVRAFEAERLHHELGLNVALPVLPLHGPRRGGRRSLRPSGGSALGGFPTLDPTANVHGVAQAAWDVRRTISWILDEQGAPRVGLVGLSLGGYVTSLVAALDDRPACAVPGIPVADFPTLFRQHGEDKIDDEAEALLGHLTRVHRVVSPLAIPPRVDHAGRYIFAGTVDRLVHPVDQVRRLWLHWDRPRIRWYPRGHVGVGGLRGARGFVDRALRDRLLT